MRKLLAIFLLGGCRVAAVDVAKQPIVGGTTTTGYPYVGYLSADFGNGTSSGCTGTLVRDHWLLAAGHCLDDDNGTKVMSVKVTFEADANNATSWHTAKSWQQHPQYGKPVSPDPVYYINRGYDCSLTELDAPVAGVAPIPYGSFALDATWVGKAVTQIGYGFTDGNGNGSGLKRMLATTIGGVHDGVLDLTDNGTGTCQGDSGGPTLWDSGGGALEVIGVASYGSAGCPGGGSMSRTELCAAWLDSVAGPSASPPDMAAPPDLASPPSASPDLASPSSSGGGGGGSGGGSGGAGAPGDNGTGGGGTGAGGDQPMGAHRGCAFGGGASDLGACLLLVAGLVLALRRRAQR